MEDKALTYLVVPVGTLDQVEKGGVGASGDLN